MRLAALFILAILASPVLAAADPAGRWGLASYFEEKDRDKTIAVARAACGSPYTIGRAGADLLLHAPDESAPSAHVVRESGGRTYLSVKGRSGAAGGSDRLLTWLDQNTFTLAFVDPTYSKRYGTMVYARCGRR